MSVEAAADIAGKLKAHRLRVLGAEGLSRCGVGEYIAAHKLPEHTRAYATRSRWAESIPACTLKTNALKGDFVARLLKPNEYRGPGFSPITTSFADRS